MPNPTTYLGFRHTTGDASRDPWVGAILVPSGARDLHVAGAEDEATDWNVANPTNPTWYVHSRTTPATDYISFAHDGTNALITVAGGTIQFGGGDVEIADGVGLIIGHTSQMTISDGDGTTNLIPELQVLGTGAADGSLLVATFSTTATRAAAPHIALLKGGDAAIGGLTIVTDNEVIGSIIGYGADGADFETAVAEIRFVVDGTPAAGQIGGSIEFYTTIDGGETPTLVATMNTAQNFIIANGNALLVGHTAPLTVSDGDGTTDLIAEAQVVGTAAADGSLLLAAFSTTATRVAASHLALAKGGAATVAVGTAVTDNEVIAVIIGYGDDGNDLESPVAAIQFVVDDVSGPTTGEMGGSLEFYTTADGGETLTLSFTINNDQNIFVANGNGVVIGHTAQIQADGVVAELQILGTAAADSRLTLGRFASSESNGPRIVFTTGNAATIVTNGAIVVDNDIIGDLVWAPADGADLDTQAAVFKAEVDDPSPTAGGVGMAFVFSQQPGNGTAAAAESLRISAARNVTLGSNVIHASTAGTLILSLFEGTAPGGTLVNGASLFADVVTSDEVIKAIDSAGNITTL